MTVTDGDSDKGCFPVVVAGDWMSFIVSQLCAFTMSFADVHPYLVMSIKKLPRTF